MWRSYIYVRLKTDGFIDFDYLLRERETEFIIRRWEVIFTFFFSEIGE